MVTGKACLRQASAYDPEEASWRVVLATLNANTHLITMSFARRGGGRKMKPFAEFRAMLEVDRDPTVLKILPRTRLRWVRDRDLRL